MQLNTCMQINQVTQQQDTSQMVCDTQSNYCQQRCEDISAAIYNALTLTFPAAALADAALQRLTGLISSSDLRLVSSRGYGSTVKLHELASNSLALCTPDVLHSHD